MSASPQHTCCNIIASPPSRAKYCDERVCLFTIISQKPRFKSSPSFLWTLPVAVTRSSSDDIIFPVSWMTSCFARTQIGRMLNATCRGKVWRMRLLYGAVGVSDVTGLAWWSTAVERRRLWQPLWRRPATRQGLATRARPHERVSSICNSIAMRQRTVYTTRGYARIRADSVNGT